MKKFLSILFAFMVLVFPFSACAAAPSPDMKSLIHIKPTIEFDFPAQDKTNLDLDYYYLRAFMILDAHALEVNWDDYTIDEALYLYLRQNHETVEFTLPVPYAPTTHVYAFIVTEEEYTFILPGIVTETGSVMFNFSNVEIDNCLMLVISNNQVANEEQE